MQNLKQKLSAKKILLQYPKSSDLSKFKTWSFLSADHQNFPVSKTNVNESLFILNLFLFLIYCC